MMERDLGFGGKFPRACVGKKSCCPISPYMNTVRFSKGCILLCSLTGVVMLDIGCTLLNTPNSLDRLLLQCSTLLYAGGRKVVKYYFHLSVTTLFTIRYEPHGDPTITKKNCCNSRINRFDYSLSIFPSEDIRFSLCLSIKIKFLSSPSPTHRSLS